MVLRGMLASCALLCSACTTLLHVDFESDPIGAEPDATLPAQPRGDRLALQGAPGSITVFASPAFGSKAVKLDRGSSTVPVRLDAVAAPGAQGDGHYIIQFKSYALADLSPIVISILSGNGRIAGQLWVGKGGYSFLGGGGSIALPAAIHNSAPHVFRIDLDLDRRRVALSVDGATVVQPRPFKDPDFSRVYGLRFTIAQAIIVGEPGGDLVDPNLPPDTGEAWPATYVVDDISIRRCWICH